MNKKEFVQQFIIHSAGPMLAIVNDRGEQRFSEADIKIIAENFADETCLGYTISDLYIEIIEDELNNCRESIKGALLEHETANNWREIKSKLQNALDYITQINTYIEYIPEKEIDYT